MGFLGSFNPVKIFENIIRDPIGSIGGAILTGGISLVSPQVGGVVNPLVSKLYDPALIPAVITATTHVPLLGGGYSVGPQAFQGSIVYPKTPQPVAVVGGAPMGFDIGQFLGGVSTILGGSQIPALNTIGQLAQIGGSFVPQQTYTQPFMTSMPQAMPVAQSTSLTVRSVGLTREIFDVGVKVLGRLGLGYPATTSGFSAALKRALSAIASLARRTPTGTIVSVLLGMGLTAYEANLLTAWSAQRRKHRRMNPANAKALRRSARRIRSFHKLCGTLDVLKSRGRSRSFGRCAKCKQTNCSCR